MAQLTTAGDRDQSLKYEAIKTVRLPLNVNIQFLGDYQTTEYAEDGIIVPKLFYKSSKDGSKKEEAIKDIISEADLRLIKEKIKDKDDEVIEKEDLSRDLEILEESNSKKIITEIVLQPQVRRSERSDKLMTRRTSNVPINTDPERPLEAMYQPSVPVVQVGANNDTAKSYIFYLIR